MIKTVDNLEVLFPVLSYKIGDKRLYGMEKKNFGFVTKGHGEFYDGLQLIDTTGKVFKIISYKVYSKSGLFKSIRNLQVLDELLVEVELVEVWSIEQIKEFILLYIMKNPKFFAPLYDGTPWKERISQYDSFEGLIRLFL